MRGILLAIALLLSLTRTAAAEVRIEASAGGVLGDYVKLFMLVDATGQNVVIDGPCLSACTMVLSLVPPERICVTRRAVLGFHAAWTRTGAGRTRTHGEATRIMMATYPAPVRAWIARRGGLSRKTLLLLRGPALTAMYRRCA